MNGSGGLAKLSTQGEGTSNFSGRDQTHSVSPAGGAAFYRDRGNFQVTQSVRSQTLARPWVTRQAVATKIAWAAGRADALPTVSGTLRVRKSKAAGLAPGSLFALNFSQNGVSGLVARVESITTPSPAKPEVTIAFREDRAFLNHPHYLPPDDSAPVDEPISTPPLSHQAVIELPHALASDQNRHWLAALAARGDNVTNGMKVWVGVEGGDYISLDIVDGFALHGQMVGDYPAATRVIDQEVRLEIELNSADKTLDDEISLEEALDNQVLLFAGTEILSVFDLQLVGLGHYRMSAVRARFDTKRKTHPAGEGVFVVRLTDLARFPHRTSRPSTNYKLQPFTLQHERDLASITPIPFALQYRARRPLYPLNLRVNGDGWTPTYATGAGVSVSWDRSDPRRNAEGPTESLAPAISRTVVELLTVGGVLKQTLARNWPMTFGRCRRWSTPCGGRSSRWGW